MLIANVSPTPLTAAHFAMAEDVYAQVTEEPAAPVEDSAGYVEMILDNLRTSGVDNRVMGKIVADQFKRLRVVLHCMNRDLGIRADRPGKIPVLTVHGRADRLFRKRGGYVSGNLGGCDAGLVAARIAIGKGQGNLGHKPCSSSVWRPRNARLRVYLDLPFGSGGPCCQPQQGRRQRPPRT